jgi:hypothetical protein
VELDSQRPSKRKELALLEKIRIKSYSSFSYCSEGGVHLTRFVPRSGAKPIKNWIKEKRPNVCSHYCHHPAR